MKKGNSDIRHNLTPGTPRYRHMLTLALWIVLLVVIAVSVYIVVIPKEGERFTEFYILGPDGNAGYYPRSIVLGQPYALIIGIRNHEYREITYTVECYQAEEQFDTVNNTSSLQNNALLESFNVTIPHNETSEYRWNFRISSPGSNRIFFLLFDTPVPAANISGYDRVNASYRDLRLIINTTPASPR